VRLQRTNPLDSIKAELLGRLREHYGRAVVMSGSKDRAIRLWDGRTGEPIGQPFVGHKDDVNSVALGQVDGRAVVVSGSGDRTVRLWDGRTGKSIGQPLWGYESAVGTVALGRIDGRPIVVSGRYDGTIRLWDGRTRQPVGSPLMGHESAVITVALEKIDGRAVVVSGSRDRTIRLWDAHGSGWNGAIQLWDARGRRGIGSPHKKSTAKTTAVALGWLEARAVAVSGTIDGTIRLWDAHTGEPIGQPLARHGVKVTVVALGVLDECPIVVSAAGDGSIRLWDMRNDEQTGGRWASVKAMLQGVRRWVASFSAEPVMDALGVVDGRLIAVSGAHYSDRQGDARTGVRDAIRLWDACSREPIGQPLEAHQAEVAAVGRAMRESG
jgi:WD40 repeat protein